MAAALGLDLDPEIGQCQLRDRYKAHQSLCPHLQPFLSWHLLCFRRVNSLLNLTKAQQGSNFYPSYMKRGLRKVTGIGITVSVS